MTAHTLAQPLTFTLPDGRELDVFACTCGRMFDAVRWAAHTAKEGR